MALTQEEIRVLDLLYQDARITPEKGRRDAGHDRAGRDRSHSASGRRESSWATPR